MNKMLYRYDGYACVYDTDIRLILTKFPILSYTPEGVWIRMEGGKLIANKWVQNKKWVSNTSKKRFAYPTEKEALESLIHRKKAQIEICKYQLEIAQMIIAKSDQYKEKNDYNE